MPSSFPHVHVAPKSVQSDAAPQAGAHTPPPDLMQVPPAGQSPSEAQGTVHMPAPKSPVLRQLFTQSLSCVHGAPTWVLSGPAPPLQATSATTQATDATKAEIFMGGRLRKPSASVHRPFSPPSSSTT